MSLSEKLKRAATSDETIKQLRRDGKIKKGKCIACGKSGHCGEVYQYVIQNGEHLPQHYCSSRCAIESLQCTVCKHFMKNPFAVEKRRKFCSPKCTKINAVKMKKVADTARARSIVAKKEFGEQKKSERAEKLKNAEFALKKRILNKRKKQSQFDIVAAEIAELGCS